jgi:Transglycosylase SLT domain/LysM domain
VRSQGRHRRPASPRRLPKPVAVMLPVAAVAGVALPATMASAAPAPGEQHSDSHTLVLDDHPQTLGHTIVLDARLGKPRYSVTKGDTLSSISKRFCDGARHWKNLYGANQKKIGDNPDLIVPGTDVKLACHHAWAAFVAAVQPAPAARPVSSSAPAPQQPVTPAVSVSGGVLSFGALEALWAQAGGPAWAESSAASVAECESGGNTQAYNPSGASGLWQILGAVVPGNLFNAYTNALNAVSKFEASGDTWAQWVCQP